MLESQGGWEPTASGWEALERRLQLTGWTAKRRVVVLRRPRTRAATPACGPKVLPLPGVETRSEPAYEYQVLLTNLKEEALTIAHLYAQRADAENVYDELKNQWGWGGFTTRDQLRCQVAARNLALVYNWWSLFVRAAEPERAREAITSRPLLLCAVGRIGQSVRQQILRQHGEIHGAETSLVVSEDRQLETGLRPHGREVELQRLRPDGGRWQIHLNPSDARAQGRVETVGKLEEAI
ncbi:MAG: transposase, partial [Verrucomicrobiae bacterium]|nr:transposase [Verrucomicrobiae bacterium]